MKKLLTVLTLGACMFFFGTAHAAEAESSGVKIDTNAFPDNFLQTYVLENIDTNKDGILQQEEAETVTALTLRKFKDADEQGDEESTAERHYYTKEEFTFDFKGLENFSNLSSLTLRLVGGLTEGDVEYPVKVSNVNNLYQLKNLKTLEINKADLKSFDCSKFPKLEKLTLTDFSELKKLVFKGNKKLKKLELWDLPKMDTLDVSSLGGLTSLTLRSVDVKTIQFGKKNSSIKSLYAGSSSTARYCTKLNSLDLSKLTGLKKLYVTNMKNLKKLDVSRNRNLQSIYLERCNKIAEVAPTKNKKLTEVDIWNCKNLKTLNLSANHKLNWLRLDGMEVKSIQLSRKNKLSFFRYANAKLKKFDVKNINAGTLTDLQLYGNKLKKVDVRKYKKLENLEVDKGVKVIGQKN